MSDSTQGWTNDGKHDPDVAGFIVEGDDCVHRVLAGARDELSRLTRNAHRSFASAVSQSGPAATEARRAVVEAIYLHLKHDYHFVYEFERAYDSATGEQLIRLPAATCRDNAGTCIDLAVLFLSCLAGAKLLPIFLQVQFGRVAHALAATWITDPPPKRAP